MEKLTAINSGKTKMCLLDGLPRQCTKIAEQLRKYADTFQGIANQSNAEEFRVSALEQSSDLIQELENFQGWFLEND